MQNVFVCVCSVPVSMLATAPSTTAAAAAAAGRPAQKRHPPPPDIHRPRVGSAVLLSFGLSL